VAWEEWIIKRKTQKPLERGAFLYNKSMEKYCLTEIVTKDDVVFPGLYYEPKIKSETAILWVHGLSSTSFSHIPTVDAFADAGDIYHFGFASFNNRGAGFLGGPHKKDAADPKGYTYISGGAGMEHFEDCVFDIDAGITFLTSRGYTKIVLVGRSTGANKACFYAGSVEDPRVAGVVLISPISDRLEKTPEEIRMTLPKMKKMIAEGKGDILLMGYSFFPMTPSRYVSLYKKGSKEDVFDYGDRPPKFAVFSKIQKPLYVILAEKDEHADRPVVEIKKAFDIYTNSPYYSSILVPSALHGFDKMEQRLSRLIGDWITQNI